MGVKTGIAWCNHTFNAWIGCSKVSPGCKFCYAEEWDGRYHAGVHWGDGAPRKLMADKYWREPLKWDREAKVAGERRRVFCSSLADVFDDQAPEGQRDRLWELIRQTPNLDWLLLTKRPENIKKFLPADWATPGGESPWCYRNVWLGVTVEDQQRAKERIPILAQVDATVRFLSCEPLLEEVDLSSFLYEERTVSCDRYTEPLDIIDWIIIGGESGSKSRLFNISWARKIIEDCRIGEAKVFMKQLGENASDATVRPQGSFEFLPLKYLTMHRKGEEPNEWPADIRIREIPRQ
jgi:protein gp37